ncbi:MAG: BNR-4 repeat-containing protein [Candidatus Brachytrichaceae bacterium NZ_4S206]|jgi:hypothetical protein
MMRSLNRFRRTVTLLAALLPAALPADIVRYEPDPFTGHLWHLDEPDAPAVDAGPGNRPLTSLTNGAVLNEPSFSGFGTALSTFDGGPHGIANKDAALAALPLVNGTGDNVTLLLADASTGAFTMEALVRVDFDPAQNLGPTPAGNGRNSPLQILSGEGDLAGERIFQFRLNPVGFGGGDATVPRLEFINLRQETAIQSVIVNLPTNGPNAIQSNTWYHVAVAYTGADNTPGNLTFYWTRLETNTRFASALATARLTNDLAAAACDFVVGNEGRATGGSTDNFLGLIDEVRLSRAFRGSNEFVFRSVALAGASGYEAGTTNFPANLLDGNLNSRWSAQGDGQWVSFDLGRLELVDAVNIAFHLGNQRTTSFDVLLSVDGLGWFMALTNVVSSGTTLDLEPFPLPHPLPARFVRIVGHGNSQNNWNSLTEVTIARSPALDTDRDGLPDAWELYHFHGLHWTGADDPDGDGLSNAYELLTATNPTVPNAAGDTDNDGLPDWWETLWFGGLGQSGADDPDRDGHNNLAEWTHGSDPTNPNSIPGDVDGDNLPDAWELTALGSLAFGAYEDTDGDGLSNLAEMLAGTSPTNALSRTNWSAPRVAFLRDSVVATNACLMPAGSTYGRAINGISFQNGPLTFNGYQYVAWYDTVGTTQKLWLGRRAVNRFNTGPWEKFDTGSEFLNGDEPAWNAHNVIALGICHTDGSLHFAWDMHGNTLRYRRSIPGLATTNLAAWGPGAIFGEQNWLVASGQSITSVTYPRFVNTPSGALRFFYRTGSTSAGDHWMHNYQPATTNWSARWKFSAKEGTFSDVSVNGGTFTSTSRNAYENGYTYGPDGTLHYTWTYRENTANPANHDIHYAYSTDNGVTWRNNAGALIANTTLGQAIRVDSPGVIVRVVNSRQLLINQQAQCVDLEGRVHVLMLHRRPEPEFAWQLGDPAFATAKTAYFHYFRDPATGVWSQRRLPLDISVGARPKIGYDALGNLYAVYVGGYSTVVTPGYAAGWLAVASTSKASQYSDWTVAITNTLRFDGEPVLDQDRLLADGILSVFIQETSGNSGVVGTPLHVLDYAVNVSATDTARTAALEFRGSDALVSIPVTNGSAYQLQATGSLAPAGWTNVGPAVPGPNGLLALPDPDGRAAEQRFYRVLRSP